MVLVFVPGVLDCPSRLRLIRFLKEARAHTKFVGSESVVAVLSAIQNALANPWELPRPDEYEAVPYHKIWAWRGDAYIDDVLIPWACRGLGIWHEGDYSLTKQVLSMTIEDAEELEPVELAVLERVDNLEPVASVIPERGGAFEPVCEELGAGELRAAGSAEEPAGTPGVSDTTTGVEVEAPRRRSWFKKLLRA